MANERNQTEVKEELQGKESKEEVSVERKAEILEEIIAGDILKMKLVISPSLFENLELKLNERRRENNSFFLADIVNWPELFLLYKKVLIKMVEKFLF
jgi:hypothetical protein